MFILVAGVFDHRNLNPSLIIILHRFNINNELYLKLLFASKNNLK